MIKNLKILVSSFPWKIVFTLKKTRVRTQNPSHYISEETQSRKQDNAFSFLLNIHSHYFWISSLQLSSCSVVWFFCHPMDYSPTGSFIHGISQTRLLKWVATTLYVKWYPLLVLLVVSQGEILRQRQKAHLLFAVCK